jgi:hypothetical protein
MCHVTNIFMVNTTVTPLQHHSSRTLGLPPLLAVCTAKERVTRHYSHRQYVPYKFTLWVKGIKTLFLIWRYSQPLMWRHLIQPPPALSVHESGHANGQHRNTNHTVRFKVLMAMSIKIMVFCDMTLPTFLDRYEHLERNCYLHLYGWRQWVPLKWWYSEISIHHSCMSHFLQLWFISSITVM